MKRGLAAMLLLVGVAYPFGAYWSLEHFHIAWLALPLAVLWLLRSICIPTGQPGGRTLPLILVVFCTSMALTNSTQWLLAYPVLINTMMLIVFAVSLYRGPPVIERLARLRHPDLPLEGVRYTRRVTQVWAGFFAVNGTTAAALALWAPWNWWVAYNGGISYVLIGLLMAGEWLLRPASAKNIGQA